MGSNTMIFAVLKTWLICRPYTVL